MTDRDAHYAYDTRMKEPDSYGDEQEPECRCWCELCIQLMCPWDCTGRRPDWINKTGECDQAYLYCDECTGDTPELCEGHDR